MPVHSTSDSVVVWQVLHWTNGSNSRTSVINIFVAGIFDKLGINSVNPSLKFMLRYSPAVAEHLSADILTDGGGPVQLEQHVGLQQVLGPVHLKVGQRCADPHPLVLDVVDHVLLVQGVCHKVNSPQSSILVAGVERLEAVTEALLSTVVSQSGAVVSSTTHGPVPVTNQSVGHHQRNVVRVCPPAALHSDGHVGQGHGVVPDPHVAPGVPAVLVQGDLVGDINTDLAEVFLRHGAELRVVHPASAGQDHPGALVVGVDVVHQVVTADALDVLGGAEDGPAQGGALVGHGVEVVEHHVLQVHLNLLHLSEDDPSVPLDLLGAEGAVGEDVGENLHCSLGISGQTFSVEDSLLPAGVGVQVSSHVLPLQLSLSISW